MSDDYLCSRVGCPWLAISACANSDCPNPGKPRLMGMLDEKRGESLLYCPLHDTFHELPHGAICPDHSCECSWTVESSGSTTHLNSRCPLHRDCCSCGHLWTRHRIDEGCQHGWAHDEHGYVTAAGCECLQAHPRSRR